MRTHLGMAYDPAMLSVTASLRLRSCNYPPKPKLLPCYSDSTVAATRARHLLRSRNIPDIV